MIETLSFKIRGMAPLLMHNGQLADPGNEWARAMKEISGKRAKTAADYEELARLEFLGGLYLNREGPIIPGRVLEGALIGKGGAARKQRMGKQAAVGLYVVRNFSLEYDGPKDPNELWKDERFRSRELVSVGQARIMRTRAIFEEWSADVNFEIDTEFVNIEDANLWMSIAGRESGLMDWRPKHGRFEVAA